MAEKPDLENGGSCNSGDEGIDTTEPVDEIEGNEPGSLLVKPKSLTNLDPLTRLRKTVQASRPIMKKNQLVRLLIKKRR